MITKEDIDDLNTLYMKASRGTWYSGHLINDHIACECAYIFDEGHAGGIATVHIDNGRAIFDGGNDAP